MATINLGAIKFNWKGAYNNGTSYAVDDVVSSGGSSYVCIQAHSNQAVGNATAYWNIMSLAGTNGSNGSAGDTFGLANKEIAFKTNAGALDGIAIGTAGQALKVNSGATGYEFGAVAGGKVLQYVSTTDNTEYYNNTGTTATSVQGVNADLTITPSATSSRILVNYSWGALQFYDSSALGYGVIRYNVNGGGMGAKVSDFHIMYACMNCHDLLDGRKQANPPYDKEWLELQAYRAVICTQKIMIKEGVIRS